MTRVLKAQRFVEEGCIIMRKSSRRSFSTFDRRFRSHFGTTPSICTIIWERLDPYHTIELEYRGVKVKHLLWALMFMKMYCAEHIHASLAGVDEKTFRKWSWIFIDAIAGLEYEVVRSIKKFYSYMQDMNNLHFFH